MLALVWSGLGTAVLLAGYWFCMGAWWKAGQLFCIRFCAVGDRSSKDWIKDPKGAPCTLLTEPCPVLPAVLTLGIRLLLSPGQASARATGGPCGPWGAALTPPPQLKGPTSVPSRGAAAPPRNMALGESPHLLSAFPCRVTMWQTAPAFQWNRTPCSWWRWPDVAVSPAAPAVGGELSGPKTPRSASAPVQMDNLEIPPQSRCVGVADQPNLLPSAKDKTSRKPRSWWQKGAGPSGTMATPSGASDGRPDKGLCGTKLQLLSQHKTGGCKFVFFHLNPLRWCKCGERVSCSLPLPPRHAASIAGWQFVAG